MNIDRKALLAAHEIGGHCTVSDNVRGIAADRDGYMVLCDPPLTESQWIAQMIAGSLAELILTHGEAIALLKLRADKSVLATDIGEVDWEITRHIPHTAVTASAERIAPLISLTLARMGKAGLISMGDAIDALKPGETFAFSLEETHDV